MGRGLSIQQRQILEFAAKSGGETHQRKISRELLKRKQSTKKRFGLAATDAQRASLSRTIHRLIDRGLLEPVAVQNGYRDRRTGERVVFDIIRLRLTEEGKQILSVNGIDNCHKR